MTDLTHNERVRAFILAHIDDTPSLFGYLRGLLDGTAYGAAAARTFVTEYDRIKAERAA